MHRWNHWNRWNQAIVKVSKDLCFDLSSIFAYLVFPLGLLEADSNDSIDSTLVGFSSIFAYLVFSIRTLGG